MTDYDSYATPPSDCAFSKQFFRNISIEDLVAHRYPAIAEQHSVNGFEWSKEVPHSTVATTLMEHDVIPHVADLSGVFEGMRDQFHAGYRSVVVVYNYEGVEYQYCFHFSKINLIKLANNYDKPRRNLSSLLRYLDSPCVSELGPRSVTTEFRHCKFLEGLSGFAINHCPLYKLASLIGERWVDQEILDALVELDYFRSHAKRTSNLRCPSPPAPVHMILPTDFLLDATHIYHSSGTVGLDSFPAGRLLRCRIASTAVSSISLCRIQDNHYTALTHEAGSGVLKYGDSMHGPIPSKLGILISRVLSTSSLQIPPVVERGVIAMQGGASGGEGSCGLAALNFIQGVLDSNTPHWRGSHSRHFRTIALFDLIRYHCVARDRVRKGEDFHTHWARPVSPQVANALAELNSATSNLEYLGSCYQDFNLYSPTTAHPILSLLEQKSTPWPMMENNTPTASCRATFPQLLKQPRVCELRHSIPQLTVLFGLATRLGMTLGTVQHCGECVACTSHSHPCASRSTHHPQCSYLIDPADHDTVSNHSRRCRSIGACPALAPASSDATDLCILILDSSCDSHHPEPHEPLFDVPMHTNGQRGRRRRYEPRSWFPSGGWDHTRDSS